MLVMRHRLLSMFLLHKANRATPQRVLPNNRTMTWYQMNTLMMNLLHRTPIHNSQALQRRPMLETIAVAGFASASSHFVDILDYYSRSHCAIDWNWGMAMLIFVKWIPMNMYSNGAHANYESSYI
ncbi:hypothetical protein K503DRAFT_509734 [Rhizopogon vinicolor AM-OR11-026]|uniref:Uncharacterized protein n=1 Tax=Rhizopogon vinicolor AM-OR11-026 TaxID=1314800 RepID=A0A1B7MM19_9AGAM|nr:hypothetical protein K503DRAFT_509734 [Rhizopogon vinicolor AM-OR11-026]